MKVVIMAGGKGTRISSVASDIPKPMIKIEGIPVLWLLNNEEVNPPWGKVARITV